MNSDQKRRTRDIAFWVEPLADAMTPDQAASIRAFLMQDALQRLEDLSCMFQADADGADEYTIDRTAKGSRLHSNAYRESIEPAQLRQMKADLLEEFVQSFSADDLRSVARRLLKVADAVDQDWQPHQVRSRYSWPSAAARIERNSLELAKIAERIIRFREVLAKYLPAEILGDTAWDMLLQLFVQFAGHAGVSTKSLATVSATTAAATLRQIESLEGKGWITRRISDTNPDITFVELTRKGVVAVGRALEHLD